jgi:predicted ATPase
VVWSVGYREDNSLRGQFFCATHSPILAITPNPEIIKVGAHDLRGVYWADLEPSIDVDATESDTDTLEYPSISRKT